MDCIACIGFFILFVYIAIEILKYNEIDLFESAIYFIPFFIITIAFIIS